MVTIPDDGAILVFSFIRLQSQEVAVTNSSANNLTMELCLTAMEEVVMVGCGTTRKGDIISTVARVRLEEFITGGKRNVGELLGEKVAELAVSIPLREPGVGLEGQWMEIF